MFQAHGPSTATNPPWLRDRKRSSCLPEDRWDPAIRTVTEALRQSPAAVQGRVYKINDDQLVRPGPRAIDGLEAMARALHPDVFKQ